MDHALSEEAVSGGARGPPRVAEDRGGIHLDEDAGGNRVGEDSGPLLHRAIPLNVGEDWQGAGNLQGKDRLREEGRPVGMERQLDEQVARIVEWCEAAMAIAVGEIGREHDLAAGHDANGKTLPRGARVKRRDRTYDLLRLGVRRVGRGSDHGYAVRGGDPQHGQRVLGISRTVVQAGEDVTVEVNDRVAVCHGSLSASFSWGTLSRVCGQGCRSEHGTLVSRLHVPRAQGGEDQ